MSGLGQFLLSNLGGGWFRDPPIGIINCPLSSVRLSGGFSIILLFLWVINCGVFVFPCRSLTGMEPPSLRWSGVGVRLAGPSGDFYRCGFV